MLKDGILYRWINLYVPTSAKQIVLTVMLDGMGHQGRDRTSHLVKKRFFWLGMDIDIAEKVHQCMWCILRQTGPVPAAELVNIISSYPMELVCIDYLKWRHPRVCTRMYLSSLTTSSLCTGHSNPKPDSQYNCQSSV